MADNPPFMNAYGLIVKILEKIKQAKTPERFTQDFLANNLGFKGGSARAFIPLAKRLGLLASDGTPTDLYKSFRNPAQSGTAIAKAIMQGYPTLYSRNENVHTLSKKDLEGLVMEDTGLKKGASQVRATCGTFEALKSLADFEGIKSEEPDNEETGKLDQEQIPPLPTDKGVKMNLAYTINLNLPKTDDIAVFNAIFKSLRENLLK